ncbi:hypothetical protein AOQ84DRAFT_386634 [Glonium stellatum]|uniref:DUF6590 domain-containing protein n=1 Tax=Glonium stellatum TaxID=574774 RepID=A0A8E2JWG0_9PEZI|nr:hypothetical protein AOQ84DRAFT_386634 [Glonium stellatum]
MSQCEDSPGATAQFEGYTGFSQLLAPDEPSGLVYPAASANLNASNSLTSSQGILDSHQSGLHKGPIYQPEQPLSPAQTGYQSQGNTYQYQAGTSILPSPLKGWPQPEGQPFRKGGNNMTRNIRHDHERLDPSYKTMPNKFFIIGRVFALLFSESLGAGGYLDSTNVAVVKYGELVHAQVRRFVVVREKRGFCYACPISTYSGRGTAKAGVNPDEHAVVYSLPSSPLLVDGEAALAKCPIRVIPASPDIKFAPASRINFAINYPIQHNLKVKDIGVVANEDRLNLILYWMVENAAGSETHSGGSKRKKVQPSPSDILLQGGERKPPPAAESTGATGNDLVEPVSYPPALSNQTLHTPHIASPRTFTSTNRADDNEDSAILGGVRYSEATMVPGRLDSRFTYITNPHGFFKKGKVFMILWAEPRGASTLSTKVEAPNESGTEQAFCEIRRFCIIRRKPTYCICLPISTYSGQATTKPGLVVQDHAVIAPVGGSAQLHPKEQQLAKSPLFLIIEDQAVSIDPMSRINFAKVYTVEYNIRIRKIGRICPDSMKDLEDYFLESMGLQSQTQSQSTA